MQMNYCCRSESEGRRERIGEGGRKRIYVMCEYGLIYRDKRTSLMSVLFFQLMSDRVFHFTLGILGYLVASL